MSGCHPPVDLSGYEPPQSLWSLVETYVPAHEREEVKIMLGASLVEQSLELHEEISLLLDIWRDYREETKQKEPAFNRLPEPPAVRERLKQEIKFFVENIRERAKENGRDPDRILTSHNTSVIDYAYDSGRASMSDGSRPSTARSSRDGRETPVRRDTPNSDRLSFASSLSDEVELVSDKLSYLKLDEAVQHLQETLDQEICNLTDDIVFLQSCLEDEAEFRDHSTELIIREPSLSEMREERSKLEKDLLAASPNMPSVPREQKQSVEVGRRPTTVKVNSGTKLRPSPPSNSKSSGPVKASHQIIPSGSQSRAVSQQLKAADYVSAKRNLGIIPIGSAQHLTIRTGHSSQNPKLVKVGSIPAPSGHLNNRDCNFQEKSSNVPSSASANSRRARPTSADRFRKMVLGCRDGPT